MKMRCSRLAVIVFSLLVCATAAYALDIFGGVGALLKTGGIITGPIQCAHPCTYLQDTNGKPSIQLAANGSMIIASAVEHNGIRLLDTNLNNQFDCDYLNASVCTVSVPLASALAAPTGYARVSPNQSIETGTGSTTTISTSCTAISTLASATKVLWGRLTMILTSGTTVGQEAIAVSFFSDSGCTTLITPTLENAYSYIGYSGLTSSGFGVGEGDYVVPIYANGAANIYAKAQVTNLWGCTGCATAAKLIAFPIAND